MTEADFDEVLRSYAGMPAAEFLLHRDSMLLLDRLLDSGGDTTRCTWTVVEGGPFVVPGVGIPTYTGVEFMAQCIAVHAGVRARANGLGPPLGFLLGTRHFRSYVSDFVIGSQYRTTCNELIRDSSGMGSYDCSIDLQGNVVAEARLSVLEKEQGQRLVD